MKELLEEILSAEAEGRQAVAAARVRAGEIIAEAGRQAGALAEAAREQSRVEAERVAAAIMQQAEREKASRLAAAGAEIERTVRLEEPELRRLSDEAVRRVLETG